MNLTHWYHIWAGQDLWRDPLAEHLWFLDKHQFDGRFNVGIVGTKPQRDEVIEELRHIRKPDCIVHADTGWEQVTLHALHIQARHDNSAILYAHTKGAHSPNAINALWRRSMDQRLLFRWQDHVDQLAAGHLDVIGCHWLTPEQYGHQPGTPMPCFGGNFWIATPQYLRTLDKCRNETRHDAEGWIGTGNPRVTDLLPGWPGDFGPVRYGRIIAGR